MAYRYGNRHQMELLPLCIEEYVGSDDPVRVYDAFVETLNFSELGLVLDPHKVGCPEYIIPPQCLNFYSMDTLMDSGARENWKEQPITMSHSSG